MDGTRSIRVPLIIRDPRMKEVIRGTTNDEFTLNVDLAPTILGAAGLPIPERMMGRDMSRLYLPPAGGGASTATEWRDEFFYEHPTINKKEYVPR
jgi:arylsulfatase